MAGRKHKKAVYHVQVKYPHTGWRNFYQVYTKATAEKTKRSLQATGYYQGVRVRQVKRRAHGFARMTRGGRVLGFT